MSKPSPGPEPLISSRLQKALTFREVKSDNLCEAELRNWRLFPLIEHPEVFMHFQIEISVRNAIHGFDI